MDSVGPWVPLENILSSHLEMYEQRRIGIHDPRLRWEGEGDRCGVWTMSSDASLVVQRTLDAWEQLLVAIESRLPNPPGATSQGPRDIPDNIIGSFTRGFLQNARIPSFKYIAPGLAVPSADSLITQPFQDWQSLIPNAAMLRRAQFDLMGRPKPPPPFPFLLFSFDRTLHTDKRRITDAQGFTWPGYPWQNADSYETGLYLLTGQFDRCLLLLPFRLNEGFARRGDGSKIKPPDNALSYEKMCNGHEMLYHPGYNHICNGQRVRLECIFKNWIGMVERGNWEVGEEGVVGGVEKFKEADTEQHWAKYVIERTW